HFISFGIQFNVDRPGTEKVPILAVVVTSLGAHDVAALSGSAEQLHQHVFKDRCSSLLEGHRASRMNSENTPALIRARECVPGKLLMNIDGDTLGQYHRFLFVGGRDPVSHADHQSGDRQCATHHPSNQVLMPSFSLSYAGRSHESSTTLVCQWSVVAVSSQKPVVRCCQSPA